MLADNSEAYFPLVKFSDITAIKRSDDTDRDCAKSQIA